MDKKQRIRKYSLLTKLAIVSFLITFSCKSNQKQSNDNETSKASALALSGELAKKNSIWPAAASQALETFNTQKKTGSVGIALISSGSLVNSGQTLAIIEGDNCIIYKAASNVQSFPVGSNQFKKVTTHKKDDDAYGTCLELHKRPSFDIEQTKYFDGIRYEVHYFKEGKTTEHEFFGPLYASNIKPPTKEQTALLNYLALFSKL